MISNFLILQTPSLLSSASTQTSFQGSKAATNRKITAWNTENRSQAYLKSGMYFPGDPLRYVVAITRKHAAVTLILGTDLTHCFKSAVRSPETLFGNQYKGKNSKNALVGKKSAFFDFTRKALGYALWLQHSWNGGGVGVCIYLAWTLISASISYMVICSFEFELCLEVKILIFEFLTKFRNCWNANDKLSNVKSMAAIFVQKQTAFPPKAPMAHQKIIKARSYELDLIQL